MSRHGDPYINRLIFSRYKIQKRVGKGSFGTVYQGVAKETNEKVAIKIEKREKNDPGTLETEAYRLIYLQGEGIPKIYCYGNNQSHNLLVEELLGKSLEDIFNSCNKRFSLKTVCVLGIEMIKRIQFVHSKYHIHRDIKPDNFMVGRGTNENKIYIIDFGLAKKYFSISKQQHIKFCEGKHLIGTARYCGRNAHRGYEQGRRDDIESIGYVLMYFLLGSLPWQGLKMKRQEDQFEKIAQKKYTTSFEELTEGQPEEFLKYFKHCDELKFEDEPDYEYLISLFQNMIDKYCDDCYYDFDWQKNKTRCFTHLSINQEMRSRDVSLLVNNNNNVSAMECSNYEEEENEEDEDSENKVKKIKSKEVFINQEDDNEPLDDENNNNDSEEEDAESGAFGVRSKHKHKNRSRSVIDSPYKQKSSKKNVLQNDINNINEENNFNNNLNNNNINEEEDEKNKISSKKDVRKKGTFRKDINEFPQSDKQRSYRYNNSNNNYLNNNINVIKDNENNENNYNYNYNYKMKEKPKNYGYNNSGENDNKNYNNETNPNEESINESEYPSEEGSKRKRNRNKSMDDNIKYREDGVKCQCVIF